MGVLTIKVALEGVTPAVWRRFRVDGSMTFHDLHKTIQACMGWGDYHAYLFRVGGMQAQGMSDSGMNVDMMFAGRLGRGKDAKKTKIGALEKGTIGSYVYDYGDMWEHGLDVEDSTEGSLAVPICLEGERACPPEDAGGVSGYTHLLKVLKDPSHKEHKDLMEWVGGEYDPEAFDADDANRDIRKYWGVALPLSPLFIPQKGKPPKSLLNHEMDYAQYFWAIESNVVGAFLDDRNITDADVVSALKALKQDPDRSDGELTALVANELHAVITSMPISRQEFNLVVDYLLWSIDNRSWMPDKQAYLKWAAWHLGAFDDEESEQYEKEITLLCKKHGVPKSKIDAILERSDPHLSEQEHTNSQNESEYFALPEERRDGFVLEHAVEDPWLMERHVNGLLGKNPVRVRRFMEELVKIVPASPLYTGLLAEACAKSGDKASALRWFREAAGHIEGFDMPEKEKEDLRALYEEQIVRLSR